MPASGKEKDLLCPQRIRREYDCTHGMCHMPLKKHSDDCNPPMRLTPCQALWWCLHTLDQLTLKVGRWVVHLFMRKWRSRDLRN